MDDSKACLDEESLGSFASNFHIVGGDTVSCSFPEVRSELAFYFKWHFLGNV
jgi:hypothetical protein